MYLATGNTMKAITHIVKPTSIRNDKIFADKVSLYISGWGFVWEEDCQIR